MYFEYEDTFFYVDILKVDDRYKADFLQFFYDVVDGLNISNPGYNQGLVLNGSAVETVNIGAIGDPIGFYSRDTGEGAIPSNQSIRLTNITAQHIKTPYDANTLYNYTIRVQSTDYSFSALGSAISTYQELMDLILAETPALLEFNEMTKDNGPQILFKSHVIASDSNTSGTGGTVTPVSSEIEIKVFANNTFSNNEFRVEIPAGLGARAETLMTYIDPIAAEILTRIPSNDDTALSFSIGKTKNMVVRGFQAQTYQDVVDTINKFEGANAIYQSSGRNKNNLYIYSAVPKSPKISDVTLNEESSQELIDTLEPEDAAAIITQKATLKGALMGYSGSGTYVQIEDFSGLTTNSDIVHVLRNSIAGGFDMLTVFQNSKRSNGSYWTEVVPIESDKKATNEVSSIVLIQKELIDEIEADTTVTPDIKRKASVDLGSIIAIGGALLEGKPGLKTLAMKFAIDKVSSFFTDFFSDSATPAVPVATADEIADDVIDDGYAPGALDGNGDVADASLLTPAQKSKLIPKPRNTVT